MAKVVSSIRGPNRLFPTTTTATQRTIKTNAVINDLRHAIARSACPNSQARDQIARQLTHEIVGLIELPEALREATGNTVNTVIRDSLAEIYDEPAAPPTDNRLAAYELRQEAHARLQYFATEADQLPAYTNQVKTIFQTILGNLPTSRPPEGALSIETPLYAMCDDPVAIIDEIVKRLFAFAPDPNDPAKRPGTRLGATVMANVLAASKKTFEQAQKNPYTLSWPVDSKLPPDKIVATYLAGTPFERYLTTPLARTIPNALLPESASIIALPGHGKTQWLQSTVLRLLDDPSRPSAIIMDSQGEAICVLSHLRRFDPDRGDHLTLIDPTDTSTLALNLFGWNRQQADTLTEMQREEMIAGVIETFKFTCEGLFGTGLTPRMQLVFQYLALWIIEIPNANVLTLIELLRDSSPYLQYTLRLSPTAQGFIEELFDERSQYRQTREHILARLHAVVGNPLFERMFAHAENKFDIGEAMNTPGHVTIINTAKAQLRSDASALFGRFWIGRIFQATIARFPRNQHALLPAAQHRSPRSTPNKASGANGSGGKNARR